MQRESFEALVFVLIAAVLLTGSLIVGGIGRLIQLLEATEGRRSERDDVRESETAAIEDEQARRIADRYLRR